MQVDGRAVALRLVSSRHDQVIVTIWKPSLLLSLQLHTIAPSYPPFALIFFAASSNKLAISMSSPTIDTTSKL